LARPARRFFSFTPLLGLLLCLGVLAGPRVLPAQTAKPVYTPAEQAVIDQLKGLRGVPDDQRGRHTADIALHIRALPAGANKVRLATGLAGLSTEGDFGHECLQAVATTLSLALGETPAPGKGDAPAYPYIELAELVRYEHVKVDLKDPQLAKADQLLAARESEVQKADFTLSDLSGKSWTLSALRGKVVLVNFWATWCPPCRKEMPDLQALAQRFADQGLVVLSISDEDAAKVAPYVAEHKIGYPILLDPGRTVNDRFHIEGIPKSFVFDRDGKLVAQSIDMRTQRQFLQMLAQAGIRE
jgi:peroxiredoxin